MSGPLATVRLGGLALAAEEDITWGLVTGITPWETAVTVPKNFEPAMDAMLGTEQTLKITSRRNAIEIKKVSVLHKLPTNDRNRVRYHLADKRYWWPRQLICRDFNMTRRTGDRTNVQNVPQPGSVTIDQYRYKRYSLNNLATKAWTAEDAVKDILKQLHGGKDAGPGEWMIDSFPIKTGAGQLSLQNLKLDDSGETALQRVLDAIPGAAVYVDTEGTTRIIDAVDIGALEKHYNSLPPALREGGVAQFIDRKHIRPSEVIVHYVREVEAVFEFKDDYSGGTVSQAKNDPALINVLPTVDPSTTATYYDYASGETHTNRNVPAGTWLPVDAWLRAMDAQRGPTSYPWNFETIKNHWLHGDLHGALGAQAAEDIDEDGNVPMRVNALLANFRQTFMISPRYMERVSDIQAIRVAVLDHITGTRAPAAVWGQITVISNEKGELIRDAKDPETRGMYLQIDTLPKAGAGGTPNLITKSPVYLTARMIDRELGIFRVEFVASPYGTDARHLPCHLQHADGKKDGVKVALRHQDRWPLSPNLLNAGGTNAQCLADKMELKAMLTLVPGAPNNKKRYHAVKVKASEINPLFRTEFRIQEGKGPPLEIFVPPNENTARFSWKEDEACRATMIRLLGLNSDDPNKAGLRDDPSTRGVDESKMLGFTFANGSQKGSPLFEDAKARAAEALAMFSDNLQGTEVTRLDQTLKLVGNMSEARIIVSSHPTAAVRVVHEFPGFDPPISKYGLMPEAVRHQVLGIIPSAKES